MTHYAVCKYTMNACMLHYAVCKYTMNACMLHFAVCKYTMNACMLHYAVCKYKMNAWIRLILLFQALRKWGERIECHPQTFKCWNLNLSPHLSLLSLSIYHTVCPIKHNNFLICRKWHLLIFITAESSTEKPLKICVYRKKSYKPKLLLEKVARSALKAW